MIVDGRAIAADILRSVKEKLQGRVLVVRAIVMSPSPATESYLKIKEARAKDAGMELEKVVIPDDGTEEDLITAIERPGANAVIVQLPLPVHIDTKRVLNAIPLTKDADLLSEDALTRVLEEGIVSPVADAVREILERSGVETAEKQAVVVGEGKLVGRPVAGLLLRMGAHVTVLTETVWDAEALLAADIVVSGAGKAGLITPAMVKKGAVLIDAGTSESGGVIVGDMDPACAEDASVFTPVPGGVGPIAVACLFRNAALLADLS